MMTRQEWLMWMAAPWEVGLWWCQACEEHIQAQIDELQRWM
jgi:hypothetical protein